jgi:hypothetical protein
MLHRVLTDEIKHLCYVHNCCMNRHQILKLVGVK